MWLPAGVHSPLLGATEVFEARLRLHLTVAFEQLQKASFDLLDVKEAFEKVVVAFQLACPVETVVFESSSMLVLAETVAFAPLLWVVELDQ